MEEQKEKKQEKKKKKQTDTWLMNYLSNNNLTMDCFYKSKRWHLFSDEHFLHISREKYILEFLNTFP